MARIRSIKPEFWRDEKIASLKNKCAGYLFIGLWNIADDEGKFKLSAKSIALELPIFRVQDIKKYLRELAACGLIECSLCAAWGLVTNWEHQKIDRPKQPKIKKQDIQWVKYIESTNDRREVATNRRKDRIGSDRIVVVVKNDEQVEKNIETPATSSVEELGSSKNNYFEKFVFGVMATSDTRLTLLSPKVEKAFGEESGFIEWADSVMNSKKWEEMDRSAQLRYFKVALVSELKLRGVVS